jgi:hypothetical protein
MQLQGLPGHCGVLHHRGQLSHTTIVPVATQPLDLQLQCPTSHEPCGLHVAGSDAYLCLRLAPWLQALIPDACPRMWTSTQTTRPTSTIPIGAATIIIIATRKHAQIIVIATPRKQKLMMCWLRPVFSRLCYGLLVLCFCIHHLHCLQTCISTLLRCEWGGRPVRFRPSTQLKLGPSWKHDHPAGMGYWGTTGQGHMHPNITCILRILMTRAGVAAYSGQGASPAAGHVKM